MTSAGEETAADFRSEDQLIESLAIYWLLAMYILHFLRPLPP